MPESRDEVDPLLMTVDSCFGRKEFIQRGFVFRVDAELAVERFKLPSIIVLFAIHRQAVPVRKCIIRYFERIFFIGFTAADCIVAKVVNEFGVNDTDKKPW